MIDQAALNKDVEFTHAKRDELGLRGLLPWRVATIDEVNESSLLRYSWTGDEGGDVTEVVYRLEPHAGGAAPFGPTSPG